MILKLMLKDDFPRNLGTELGESRSAATAVAPPPIFSKSMRRILSGVIRHPHFGQTALRDALTFSRLIFCL